MQIKSLVVHERVCQFIETKASKKAGIQYAVRRKLNAISSLLGRRDG
jgi:hypothetical protein